MDCGSLGGQSPSGEELAYNNRGHIYEGIHSEARRLVLAEIEAPDKGPWLP